MKIYIKKGSWEDAIRIELHLSIVFEDGSYYCDEKYKHRVEQLKKEGVIDYNE